MYANFQGSSIKTYNFENEPHCTFNPPPSTEGGGYWILVILQKSHKISRNACEQNFRAAASKLRITLGVCVIWIINPIAL